MLRKLKRNFLNTTPEATYNNYKEKIIKLVVNEFGYERGSSILVDMQKTIGDAYIKQNQDKLQLELKTATSKVTSLEDQVQLLLQDITKLTSERITLNERLQQLSDTLPDTQDGPSNCTHKKTCIQNNSTTILSLLQQINPFTGADSINAESNATINYHNFKRDITTIFDVFDIPDQFKILYFKSRLAADALNFFNYISPKTYSETIKNFDSQYLNPLRSKETLKEYLSKMKRSPDENIDRFGFRLYEIATIILELNNQDEFDWFFFEEMVNTFLKAVDPSLRPYIQVEKARETGNFHQVLQTVSRLVNKNPDFLIKEEKRKDHRKHYCNLLEQNHHDENQNTDILHKFLQYLRMKPEEMRKLQEKDERYGTIINAKRRKNQQAYQDYEIKDKMLFYIKSNGKEAICLPQVLKAKLCHFIATRNSDKPIKHKIIEIGQKFVFKGMKKILRNFFNINVKFG